MFYKNRLNNTIIYIAGISCLVTALASSWFSVPISHGSTIKLIQEQEIYLSFIYRVIIFLILAYSFSCWKSKSIRLYTYALFFILTFPSSVIFFGGDLSSKAIDLDTQLQKMTWLGGNIANSQETRQNHSFKQVKLVDIDLQVNPLALPIWHPLEINLNHLPKLLEYLGFNSTFSMFGNSGWILAILGFLLLITSKLETHRHKLFKQLQEIRHLPIIFLAYLALILLPFYLATYQINLSKKLITKNDYHKALKHLENASNVLPLLKSDYRYLSQKLYLTNITKPQSLNAKIWKSLELESQQLKLSAIDQYLTIYQKEEAPQEIKNLIKKLLTRRAIKAYNSNQIELAKDLLLKINTNNAADIDISYYLAWIALRTNNQKLLVSCENSLQEILSGINHLNKKSLQNSILELRLVMAQNNDDLNLARAIQQKIFYGN